MLNTVSKVLESLIQELTLSYEHIRCSFTYQSLLHLLAAGLGIMWVSYKCFIAGVHVKTVTSHSCFCTRKQWDNTSLEQQRNCSLTVYVSQVFLHQQNICCWFGDLSFLLSTRAAVTTQQSDLLLGVLCYPQGKRSCEMLIVSINSLGFNLNYSKVSQSVSNLYPKLGHP